jgi:hypothetical protein
MVGRNCYQRGTTVGLMDSIKGMFKKNEKQVDQGIDRGETMAHGKLDDRIGADKIDTAGEHAHDAADKLGEG